ncbi:MAG: lambda exonuclease family protein [Desulfuromonadaceae bacterium]
MITLNIPQGTPEWKAEKCGKPSSSHFDEIITSKGARSKQWEKYLYKLAGERITGVQADNFSSGPMAGGVEKEPEARELWQLLNNIEVDQVGVCYRDESRDFLCSPDGLIGSDGGLEIKCPLIHTHVEYLLDAKLPTAYFQQVQGSLFVTGREYWEFMSYYPGMRPLILTVKPDPVFHAALGAALVEFCAQLDKVTEAIR